MSANDHVTTEETQDRVSAMLVNVYGLKLPSDMFSQAARSRHELAQILHEYAEALDKAKR